MPHLTVKSLHSEPFPAMLPRAQTAWSTTFMCSDPSSRTKCGTAPGHTQLGMECRHNTQNGFYCYHMAEENTREGEKERPHISDISVYGTMYIPDSTTTMVC